MALRFRTEMTATDFSTSLDMTENKTLPHRDSLKFTTDLSL
jgi:hypothetical protein